MGLAVAASRGHEGAFPIPQSEASSPPVRRKKWQKSTIFDEFLVLDFCPLRNTFCPLNAPPTKNKKQNKKQQKKFWCRHWGLVCRVRCQVLGLIMKSGYMVNQLASETSSQIFRLREAVWTVGYKLESVWINAYINSKLLIYLSQFYTEIYRQSSLI